MRSRIPILVPIAAGLLLTAVAFGVTIFYPQFGGASTTDDAALVQLTVQNLTAGVPSPPSQPQVMGVGEYGGYGLTYWMYYQSGGVMVFQYQNSAWQKLFGGGGSATAADLEQLGVPSSVAPGLIASVHAPPTPAPTPTPTPTATPSPIPSVSLKPCNRPPNCPGNATTAP